MSFLFKNIPFIVLASFILMGCSTEKGSSLFDDLTEKDTVVLYLKKYNLKSVPEEIGKLKQVKFLFITVDSIGGWTIYPPLSSPLIHKPPFRKLPDQIGELRSLRSLGLIGLDLSELPNSFSNLDNLDSLDLSKNKLIISNEIEKLNRLKNLKYLRLLGNTVSVDDIVRLKKYNPNLTVESL